MFVVGGGGDGLRFLVGSCLPSANHWNHDHNLSYPFKHFLNNNIL